MLNPINNMLFTQKQKKCANYIAGASLGTMLGVLYRPKITKQMYLLNYKHDVAVPEIISNQKIIKNGQIEDFIVSEKDKLLVHQEYEDAVNFLKQQKLKRTAKKTRNGFIGLLIGLFVAWGVNKILYRNKD